ncbi:hypothetical protein [Serratia plymuthica]|uniref:Uncharacterized protein n=1 Tax=Serratia plymuthica TaxID=82996 RepID=A0A2X4WUW6_SERPL|nr:hypothetical protein [Serratia plymuthica]QPS22654.1 hypothetical protein I6G64_09855 [Serratia plymuthica]QPS55561.1 hypothetical protein I6G53_23540 [Serratia plymuthica]QPS64264.1 hypothetical protein I6G52_05645 [Serratia plymuthica]RKS63324.1 hypothetical protein C8E17_2582 [Serratia plymuthica]CAI1685261.1 Uncharacterised protein [Serratia plymuthica]
MKSKYTVSRMSKSERREILRSLDSSAPVKTRTFLNLLPKFKQGKLRTERRTQEDINKMFAIAFKAVQ